MQRRPRGREAERTGPEPRLDDGRHGGDVVGCRRFVGGAAVTHHVAAYRPVCDLGPEIERVVAGIEGVEELLEALPVPRDPLGHRRPRDVLDTLHQLDQPLVTIGCGGCEADAAVAHDRRRDAVPGRRREVRVPRGLCVVVRVDVDPAGSEQESVGVDLAGGCVGLAGTGHRGDPSVRHGDVGWPPRRAASVDEVGVANDQIIHAGSVVREPDGRDVRLVPCSWYVRPLTVK